LSGTPRQRVRHRKSTNHGEVCKAVENTARRLSRLIVGQFCDRRFGKPDLICSSGVALDLRQRAVATHGGNLLRRGAVLCEPAQRRFAQTMSYAPRRKLGALDRRLDQLGKVPRRPATRVGDEVLHAYNLARVINITGTQPLMAAIKA